MSIDFTDFPQNAKEVAKLYIGREGGKKGFLVGVEFVKAGKKIKNIKNYLRVVIDGKKQKLELTTDKNLADKARDINKFMLKFSHGTDIEGVKTIKVALKIVIDAKVKDLKGFRGLLRRLFTSIKKDLNRIKKLEKKINIAYNSISTAEAKANESYKKFEKKSDNIKEYLTKKFSQEKTKKDELFKMLEKELKVHLKELTTKKNETQEKLKTINELVQKLIDEFPDEAMISTEKALGSEEVANIFKMVKLANKMITSTKRERKRKQAKKLQGEYSKYKREIPQLEKDVRLVEDKIKEMEKLL